MKTNKSVQLFLSLAKTQAKMNRRFDAGLGGLGLNEFTILLQLSQAEDNKMRRVDLAESVGLTASGITRLLLPMEKVGLTKKEVDDNDARASFVVLASGGKRRLEESLERAELLTEEILQAARVTNPEDLSSTLESINRVI